MNIKNCDEHRLALYAERKSTLHGTSSNAEENCYVNIAALQNVCSVVSSIFCSMSSRGLRKLKKDFENPVDENDDSNSDSVAKGSIFTHFINSFLPNSLKSLHRMNTLLITMSQLSLKGGESEETSKRRSL
ncbi:unnamed protein product [Heterobilharzia americana]|nr:unnamed protein product [Heterobilharzia americana]